RFRADARAWVASAFREAALWPSRFNAALVARDRVDETGLLRPCPDAYARFALVRVASEVCPRFGGGRSTPARRAFDRPIAIACFVERTPCLPSRTCSISSRTNSPACVDGDLPSRLSRRALCNVFLSGMGMLSSRKMSVHFRERRSVATG